MMDAGINLAPVIPLWAVALFAGSGLVLTFLGGLRPAALLRLLGVAFFTLALLNPALQIDERRAENTIVLLATDRSGSQTLGERQSQTQAALENLRQRLGEHDSLDVREIGVGHGPEGTDLIARVNEALQTLPHDRLGAVITLTDGAVRPGRLDLDEGVPFHRLITGSDSETDRALRLLEKPRFVPVGESAEISIEVEAFGSLAETPATVEVRRGGETLVREQVQPNSPFSLDLPISRPGPNRFIVRVADSEAELTPLNNMQTLEVEGTRDILRVLLVSGAPHAGERTWREVLKSDPAVDLVHFTILRPPYKQDATPVEQLALIAFPTYELFVEKLHEFDLIIFDRYQRIGVLPPYYFENIADYVRSGGALLVASGPEYAGFDSIYSSSLASVLPAVPSGNIAEGPYYAALSEVGGRHPVTRVLPGAHSDPPSWGRWFRTIPAEVRTGRTLMEDGSGRPLLVLSQEGEGRVAQMLSDQAWLWARGVEGGGPYVPLLRRLVHWLMGEPELESERLELVRQGEDLFIERQTEGAEVGSLEISGKDFSDTRDMMLEAPGRWRVGIDDLPPGIYRASQDDLSLDFLRAADAPAEYADVQSSLSPLDGLNLPGRAGRLEDMESDLNVLRVTSGTRLDGRGWIGVREREASSVVSTASVPLFTGLVGLGLVALVLSLIWGLEGGGALRRRR